MCHNVLNVWPKITLLLPVWPRDTKRSDTLIDHEVIAKGLHLDWEAGDPRAKPATAPVSPGDPGQSLPL